MGKSMPKKNVDRRAFLKGAALAGMAPAAQAAQAARKWDQEADVVVIGSGASGLPASIIARENNASVILVEANRDIGGHAAVSTGNIPLGGGTAAQKAAGIVDSPDILFRDLIDWSVVGGNGAAEYRFNDRDIVRAFADNNVFAYDFLVAHGLTWTKPVPDRGGMTQAGKSAPRAMHAAIMQYERIQTGVVEPPDVGRTTSGGIGIVRPLEAAARKAGVQILLQHRMTSLIRENNATAPRGRNHRGGQGRKAQYPRPQRRHRLHRRQQRQRRISAAYSILASPRNTAATRASPILPRMPAEKSPPWRSGHRFGAPPTRLRNTAPISPSQGISGASTDTPPCFPPGNRPASISTWPAPSACRSRIFRT